MNLRIPIAAVAAGGLLAGSAGDLGAQDDPAPPAPVEFTMCGGPGPAVTQGTEVVIEVSLPEEMTIEREQGYTFRSTVNDVSDPRLEGTWYQSYAGFSYTLPGGDPGSFFSLFADTHRMENDEGAWQGSELSVNFPDGESLVGPLVMVGEGAYEGLTAVMNLHGHLDEDCPNVRGYIVEESVPPPPVPQTGQ